MSLSFLMRILGCSKLGVPAMFVQCATVFRTAALVTYSISLLLLLLSASLSFVRRRHHNCAVTICCWTVSIWVQCSTFSSSYFNKLFSVWQKNLLRQTKNIIQLPSFHESISHTLFSSTPAQVVAKMLEGCSSSGRHGSNRAILSYPATNRHCTAAAFLSPSFLIPRANLSSSAGPSFLPSPVQYKEIWRKKNGISRVAAWGIFFFC
jgi:hypothetical protein